MTKEELLKQNSKFNTKLELQKFKEEDLRKEFAKAFDWYKEKENFVYSNDKELITPSWEEIFVEVGKLLSKKSNLKLREDLENAENNINRLYEFIDELKNDKEKRDIKDLTTNNK